MKLTLSSKRVDGLSNKYVRLLLVESKNPTTYLERKDDEFSLKLSISKKSEMTPRKFRHLIRSIVLKAKELGIEFLALDFPGLDMPKLEEYGRSWVIETVAENILLANYEFKKYKTVKSNKKILKEIVLCCKFDASDKKAWSKGQVIAESMNEIRELSNLPASNLSPSDFAKAVSSLTKNTKIKTKIIGEKEMKKLGMNALLAVGQGSRRESKFIILEYFGQNGKERPVVYVGKGITFDTGGLNVKPAGYMHEEYLDMTGAAAVLGSVLACARLGLKKNVIGLLCCAENSISDESMRPSDIVTAMNKKTIEIIHTDAEGRMVLADGLCYAERYKPKSVFTIAGLTGAALVALGEHATALMTKDKNLQQKLQDIGEETGDYCWPLPLWDEYQPYINSQRADIANIAPNFKKYGGTIEGGIFLSHFVPKDTTFAHLDTAPRRNSNKYDRLAPGATGEPVRLLVKFIEKY